MLHEGQLTEVSEPTTGSVSFRVYAWTYLTFSCALASTNAHVCLLRCSVTRLSTTLKANLHHEAGLMDRQQHVWDMTVHAHMYRRTHTGAYTYVVIHVLQTHVHVSTHIRTCTHTHTHQCAHTYEHTHHTHHTHTHTNAHTYSSFTAVLGLHRATATALLLICSSSTRFRKEWY